MIGNIIELAWHMLRSDVIEVTMCAIGWLNRWAWRPLKVHVMRRVIALAVYVFAARFSRLQKLRTALSDPMWRWHLCDVALNVR